MELYMTNSESNSISVKTINDHSEEEYSIPIDISDIIYICQEYNKLGWKIQNQIENILEIGVEEAINKNIVKKESLPHIKCFLKSICKNAYFGDAVDQSYECIYLIEEYEGKLQNNIILN